MRIGCLQFAPQIGDVNNNLNRANLVLNKADPQDLDLLILPELAFSGCGFTSLQQIQPYLERTASGISSLWARVAALRYNCVTIVGYPEEGGTTSPKYHNSSIVVNGDGETVTNYRQLFLSTDGIWASEGERFFVGQIAGLGNVAMGIGTDLDPSKHWDSWQAQEFAYHVLHQGVNLVLLPMASLTPKDARSYSQRSHEPDLEILRYWISRLEPLLKAETEDEIIVVLVNRCGTEGEAVYAGSSVVLGFQAGEVKLYDFLGCGEKKLLVVDTTCPPRLVLVPDHYSVWESSMIREPSYHAKPDPTISRPVSTKSRNASTHVDQFEPSLLNHQNPNLKRSLPRRNSF